MASSTNARKEVVKALQKAFVEHSEDAFQDHEPPQYVLAPVEAYLSSSEIGANANASSERDLAKIRQALLEDCYEQGVEQAGGSGSSSSSEGARSALLVLLDKIAAYETGLVSPKEIRNTWWKRVLKPALSVREGSERIQLGRTAAEAARNLVIRAISDTEDQKEVENLRRELFKLYIDSKFESSANKSVQIVLISWGRLQPQLLFKLITDHLAGNPAPTLRLLIDFIRTYPMQAHRISSTSLFQALLGRLESLSLDSSAKVDLVSTASTITAMCMILPRVPTILERNLARLFLVFVHTLLWHDKHFHHPNIPLQSAGEGAETINEDSHDHPAQVFAPLLDYFTTLYGLFPSNFLKFLTNPASWTKHLDRKGQRRRRVNTGASLDSASGAALAQVSSRTSTTSNTSASKAASDARSPGTARRESDSKRLTQQQKQKRTGKIADRSILGGAATPTGMPLHQSSSSSESEDEQAKATSKLDSRMDSSSSDSEDSDAEQEQALYGMYTRIQQLDWESTKALVQPYLVQHHLTLNILLTPEQELARSKLHFKKVEASDLVDEALRTRALSTQSPHESVPPPLSATTSVSQTFSSANVPAHSELQERIFLLHNQLMFETYSKEQLVSRLGAVLREHVVAGGIEADKQNLMQTVRFYRNQLTVAQDDLTRSRKESAIARELLNNYSNSQSARLETLRDAKRAWTAEGNRLRAELEDAQSSVQALSEKLAQAEKNAFELENEQKYQKEVKEREERDKSEEVEKLKAEVERLKNIVDQSN